MLSKIIFVIGFGLYLGFLANARIREKKIDLGVQSKLLPGLLNRIESIDFERFSDFDRRLTLLESTMFLRLKHLEEDTLLPLEYRLNALEFNSKSKKAVASGPLKESQNYKEYPVSLDVSSDNEYAYSYNQLKKIS